MLKYLKSTDINNQMWDDLVNKSSNANIFCFSWYLTNFCDWDAIVLDDYSGAIALPRKTRYGVKILYQPIFIQKCVWFGQHHDTEKIAGILTTHFRKIHFNSILKKLVSANI